MTQSIHTTLWGDPAPSNVFWGLGSCAWDINKYIISLSYTVESLLRASFILCENIEKSAEQFFACLGSVPLSLDAISFSVFSSSCQLSAQRWISPSSWANVMYDVHFLCCVSKWSTICVCSKEPMGVRGQAGVNKCLIVMSERWTLLLCNIPLFFMIITFGCNTPETGILQRIFLGISNQRQWKEHLQSNVVQIINCAVFNC